MTPAERTALIQAEEAKRQRAISAERRWNDMIQFFAWVDSQQPIRRNTPQGCKAKEAKLLAGLCD
jgi:hypothetical protein